MQTVAEHIHDGRFLRLIRELLQAGYLEEWRYNATLSGAPQGGIVSPILSNIYLNKLDQYVENTLIPMSTKGARRKKNLHYDALLCQGYRLRKRGRYAEAAKARKAAQKLPSVDLCDPDYRRLRFVRYADDWLLGLIGTKEEAEQIKEQVKTFLREELGLELSDEKTLITHARTEPARFLSYHISASQDDTRQTKKKRSVNGVMHLRVPPDLLKKKCHKYQKNNKPIHRKELTNNTEYSIVAQYQSEFRGFAQYYQLANNLYRLNTLKWIMEQSLAKTLATKLKMTVKKVHKEYGATWTADGKTQKGLQVTIQREGKKPLIAKWGAFLSRENSKQSLTTNHRFSGPTVQNWRSASWPIPASYAAQEIGWKCIIFGH
jgi:hypothetical protein